MYKERAFLLTLVLLGASQWVSCSEAPVEMKEENEIKQEESDEKDETATKKVLSSDINVEDPDYQQLYRDMLNEDLPTEEAEEQEEKGSARTVLDSSNFEATVKHGYTFVKFYAPWCGHCQEMAPDWNDLANHFFEKPIAGVDLTIAEVDCVEAAMTCMDEGVDGYPSIKLYKDGNVMTDYFFARSLDRMKRFLSDKLVDIDQIEPNTIGVYTLNDLSFTKFVEKSDEVPVLVKFYIPGCEHCKTFQEVYDELVIKFMMEESEDLKFAEVNCMDTDSLDTCTEESVDGFPAVHLYKGGVLEDIFDGERTVEELSNFVWQTVDPSRVESNDAMDEYMNLASLMGNMGGGEEEFEECDCSEPDCDCEEEDDLEELYEDDYIDEDEDNDEEEYEEGEELDDESEGEFEEEDEEYIEEDEESIAEDDKSIEEEDQNKVEEKTKEKIEIETKEEEEIIEDSEKPEENTEKVEENESLKDKIPETKKDEL